MKNLEYHKITDRQEWLKLRSDDVTSTEVSALFGCNPYMTKYELWYTKKDKLVTNFKGSDRVRWGTYLEPAIAKGLASEHSLCIEPFDFYIRDPEDRMGSSFDFSIDGDKLAILEIKNVDYAIFKKDWIVHSPDDIEAPPHIELQVQHQLEITGYDLAYLGVLVGGNTSYLIEKKRNEKIGAAIRAQIKTFWDSIHTNSPPPPDFERDSKFIIECNQYATPGSAMTANTEIDLLVESYKNMSEEKSRASKNLERIKAQILDKIGDAEKVLGDGYTISAGMVGPTELSFTRKGYRNFGIYRRKNVQSGSLP